MLEPSTSSSSTTLVGSSGRPRSPAVQNRLRRSVLSESRSSSSSPDAPSRPAPRPRVAQKRCPFLSSCTTPNDTSPSRASSLGGTTATDTHPDSSPPAPGRLPSPPPTTPNPHPAPRETEPGSPSRRAALPPPCPRAPGGRRGPAPAGRRGHALWGAGGPELRPNGIADL